MVIIRGTVTLQRVNCKALVNMYSNTGRLYYVYYMYVALSPIYTNIYIR